MNLVIQTVNAEAREWDGPNGTIMFLSGQFTDGTEWSLGCKPDNLDKRRAELEALIGVPGEYEVEAKGEYQGRPQVKVKSWPGKAAFGGGSGGGGGSYYNSKEGVEYTQERMDRRTALMQANDLEQAEAMYEWLRATAGATPFTPPSPDRPSVGAWGEKVTADPPPVASPPSTGEGVGGSAAKGDGNGLREGADNPSLFAKLSDAYGGGSKGSALALKTARLYYPDAKPKSLSELSVAQVEELIAEAERV